ncbi:glyoxylase-like metal-dependent hydrolase (beta-lactamase superfamily II) [Salirhabdus euzebyi]|uniref:Glyoxylase-like metal-dependent hydrolase (Beta-lactamase superfamily II) n=1 Tax=Salirhabdus euzebyi TaxID=394506 RepID=A0A841Q5W8_9BACI|nr:MBL fold metallo-hydrolase [Salirhabdus euzebyi]MBB6453798.1 glyoxylase-like metal-dependent hydrolase (beta-lactamase superfamily II) [Salirhabdus euzebyi]
MRVLQEGHLYQITFMPNFFPVSCYLVEEKDGLTLIDAALPYSMKGILQTANKIGKRINRIVLTHGHGDHVGALDALKEQLPDVPVYISARDNRLLAGDRSLDEHEANKPIRGGVPKKVKTRADILLKDGDEIGSLLTISSPGHTPGSMSFLDSRTHALIVGDAFQTKGGLAVTGQMRPLFPFPAMATWDKQKAVESAKKLVACKPTILAVGHGKMIKNPISLLEKAVEEAEKRNKEN